MIENQKSGQKIKAKVTKIPFSHINSTRMSQASNERQGLPFQQFLDLQSSPSLQSPSNEKKEYESGIKIQQQRSKGCHLDEQKLQMLRYFGIPENYGCHIQEPKQYCQNVCNDRINSFQNGKHLQLDVRDQRIRIPLNSQYLQKCVASKSFGEINPLLDEIRDWLIDVIEITTSISFNQLKKGSLAEKQVKNYAAKNILLNVKQMFESLNPVPLPRRFQIMKYVNSETQKIIQNVIMKYPQTSSKGASRRIKSKIRRIDNRQNDQYDFLHKNGIKIAYKKSGDYSQEVMKVLNKLIAFSSDTFHPNNENEETNFQVFTQIMEYIFENSWSQPTNTMVSDIAELISMKMRLKGENYLLNSTNITELRQAISFSERVQKKSSTSKQLSSKDYLIGQKIPSGTPLYTDQEVEGGSFKVHDSSILRILTKWAQELRDKIQNAQQALSKRSHKFKSKNGKFVNLDNSLKEKLYFTAQEEQISIKSYMQFLNKENIALQIIFAQENNIGKYSKHDTKVGIFSAKINEIASQYMFKYVNKLIHALLLIPRAAAAEISNQAQKNMLSSVNLVTLKIGDLMRSKYSCNQQQFLKILSVLEDIDCKHPQIIKIVRIKNRLDQKDSDVLINIYFMDKVQCQIQLSIKGLHNKVEKDYSGFNHFLYEIIRSKLGPISQMANIVTQYDPLIHHFKRMNQYGPELLTHQWLRDKKQLLLNNLIERLKFKKQMGVARSLQLPFICCNCFHLATVSNPNFYYRVPGDLKLDMIQNCGDEAFSYLMQHSFKDEEARSFFTKHLEHWDQQKEIKQLQTSDDSEQCKVMEIPLQGFYLKRTNKLPKMVLYSAVYESVSNSYLFMTVDQKGTKKIIAKVPLYLEKKKRVEAFKKQLQHFYFFKFQKVRRRIENGVLYLSCAALDCCNKDIRVGPMLSPSQIVQNCHFKGIQCVLNNQKSLLDLNSIPKALEKVKQALSIIQDPAKSERIVRSIQNVKAFGCNLPNIQIVSKFVNLTDLNINNNRNLKSLKGLEECHHLKNLQSMNCDIENINELSFLEKLQNLNLKGNSNLKDIKGLENHTRILDLNIAFTSVASLEPLEKCLQIESLIIEGCKQINSLAHINSSKLTYLNMVDCFGLQQFDLQLKSYKSLKNIQYVKNSKEKIGFEMIFASLNYLEEDEEDNRQISDEQTNLNVNLQKINQVLKFNKKKVFQKLFIHTIP